MTTARRSFTTCTMSIVIGLLCLSHSSAQIKPESIAGMWLMDEGSGTIARDSSGHGYDADLKGNPKWVVGKFGRALEFDGTNYLEVRNSAKDLAFGGVAPFSATAWVKTAGGGTIIGKFNGGVIGAYIVEVGGGGTISFHREVAPWAYSGTRPLPSSDWGHAAITYDGAVMKIYVNGVFDAQQDRGSQNTDTATPVTIGARLTSGAPSQFFRGALDEVALFNVALTEDQIKLAMKGLAGQVAIAAANPTPEDGGIDVPRDTSLGWTAAATAATHNVYFGASREDVNAASVDAPRDVLVGKGQTETTYTPAGVLTYGQTCFWRVDEVNDAPDFTVFRGKVWSFTVEPYSYPVKPTKATASSSQIGMGPEKTIDGSGMTGDLHGTEPTTMWLSSGAPPNWIQYEFDRVYKLHEMQVWNSNQLVEGFLGFGSKTVAIETSADGVTWTPVADVPEFSRAPAAPDYAANTAVSLGGVDAKFVKLTISANWGGVAPPVGLAEVRFTYTPTQAFGPQPATAAKDVKLDALLNWRPGREATSHQVYFGTDPNAVANGTAAAKTVTGHSFTPDSLNLGTVYYWKVDEVAATGTYEGDVWSFTTQDYTVVDDFESYTDEGGAEVFSAWIDGFDNPKANGALVGNAQAPFAEQTIIHGGGQSMPLSYDNSGAPVSEATLALDQNWTDNGIKSLSLWFRGTAGNTGQLYVKINKIKIAYNGSASDIAQTLWQPWNIDLSAVAGLNQVTSLTLGIEGAGAKGTLYVDDVRLYPKTPEFITPVQPAAANLVARYTFDGDFRDSAGSHHGTAIGTARIITDAARGQVLSVNGSSDMVDVPYSADLNPTAFTVSVWAHPLTVGTTYRSPVTSRDDTPQRGYILYIEPTGSTWQFWTGTPSGWNTTTGPRANLGEWTHVAATYVNNQKMLYVNGRLVGQGTAALTLNTARPLRIGAGASESATGNYFFNGLIDDVRFYKTALSAAEIVGLTGRTEPMAMPF
jgi:hypothetical protein